MEFIDAHAHLRQGPEALQALLNTMDTLGIERTIVVPGGTVTPYELARRIASGGEADVPIDNAATLAQCRASGGRLWPFFFANPHRGPGEYEKSGPEYAGLKFAPAVHGVPLIDARIAAFLPLAERFGHSVYLHCLSRPGFFVEDLAKVAADFPRVKFMLGHAGIGPADYHALDVIASLPNILFETSGGFSGVCKEAVRRLGAERVIFGSEYPLQDPRVELAKAQCLGLEPEALARYLRLNALDLLPEAAHG